MSHLEINNDICTSCFRCVKDCPMGIPEQNEKLEFVSNEENAELCIYCGHCVAVCPVNAIALTPKEKPDNLEELEDYGIIPFGLTWEDCEPSLLSNIPDASSLEALIKSRRMTRSFRSEKIPEETISHIVNNILVYAPSGHNSRGYKATIVEGREKLDELAKLSLEYFEMLLEGDDLHTFDAKVFKKIINAWGQGQDRIFRTASQVIVIHCKSSIVPADPAVKVMLTYFEMLCNSMGIGTVWAGYFMVAANYPPIKKYLGIPDDESIYGSMMFGYPEFLYDKIPKRPKIELNFV